ncbi:MULTISPECIES: PDR/VanB family oxidoreductase [Azospirillum]|nr:MULTISPECIES: PDR/VanB family oxidoreductase [Azospirillum]MDR6775568.1 phthalate 4,5-dioxygenase reductase subunit [Azospirillum sp. BE72]
MAEDIAGTDMTTLRVRDIARLADDIVAFELVSPDGAELPPFTAGAHLSVRVPNGAIRRYSLCNDPAERDRYVIAVKRDAQGRGGSISLIDDTRVGDRLTVSAPRNDFPLDEDAAHHIFIAGGIGITPILSMIRRLRAIGGSFSLYYCTRTPEMTAFRAELSIPELADQVVLHHDGGDPACALDLWPVLETRPRGAHLYCCGPRPLMQAVRDMTGHWPPSAVHFEDFGTTTTVDAAEDRPFTVRLAHGGDTVEVPAGVSILEALRGRGLNLPSSCESGSCGSCLTGLVDGDVDHRDLVLTPEERKRHIIICVSRAKSGTLTLDL